MIAALERFDEVTAAGILARAALALDGNPAGEYRLANEATVRQQLIQEVLLSHGLQPGDETPYAMGVLNDALDDELDSLIAPRDPASVLARLSEKGELPSDLFEIEIIPQLAEFHGRRYGREQHGRYGRESHAQRPGAPHAITPSSRRKPDRVERKEGTL